MKISPAMAVLTVALILAFLGLAAIGTGGIGAFFARPQFVALALITLALAVVALFAQVGLTSGEREERGNRWVLAAFVIIGGLLGGYLPAYTDRIDFWTLDGDALRWLGVVLFAAGGVLRIWPMFVLGPRFSGLVAIQPGHALVTTGIYGTIRHPSYLGLLVNGLGWALAFRSGVGVLLVALILAPLLARIRSEEALMRQSFGAEYESYAGRTWRLVPYVY